MDVADRWMSVDEVAEYFGVSKDNVYAWVIDKDMPDYRVGRFWKFKRDDVDDWVRADGAEVAAEDDLTEGTPHE